MLWRNSKLKPIFGFHRRLLLCYEVEAHFQCENSSPMLCSTLMCDSVTSPCGLGPPLLTPHLTAEPLQLSYFLSAKIEPQNSSSSLAWHMLHTGDAPCFSNSRKKILATAWGMGRNVLLSRNCLNCSNFNFHGVTTGIWKLCHHAWCVSALAFVSSAPTKKLMV